MKQDTTTTTTATTTTATTTTATKPDAKQPDTVRADSTTTTATTTTTANARPKKAVYRRDVDEMEQRNADAKRTAQKATVETLHRTYDSDPVKALHDCDHRDNKRETPVLTAYEYTVETVNSTDDITTETATGYIPFDVLFFVNGANRSTVNSLFAKIGRTATEKPERATNATGKKHVNDVREIIRLIGFGILSDTVNPSTVANIMNDARITTGRGNRQFDTTLAKLSLFGFLWATANDYKTTSVFIREQDRKQREREQREREKNARRDANRKQREKNRKKGNAKPNAKPDTATPAK